MKRKHFVLVALSSLVAVGGVLAFSSSSLGGRMIGADAVYSWTEKAYVAPTGESVGYKHHYLGCPGVVRTTDAEHENFVTIDELTIPALNVIDSSEVEEGSTLLDINPSKIKKADQSTTWEEEGGTPVFVEDQGRQAVFFSRSNNLVADDVATEFRFTKTVKNIQSITFDYRYLDFCSAPSSIGSEEYHAFTQVKTSAGAYPLYFQDQFINDDEWHTGSFSCPYGEISNFLVKIYNLQGHIYIANVRYNALGELETPTAMDLVPEVSNAELGLADSVTIPQDSAGHVFANYNYLSNGGIDMWFDYTYDLNTAEDSYLYIYLFNGKNEDGVIFRLQANRAEDDGIVFARVYSRSAYGGASTVQAEASASLFYLPRPSGVKSTVTNTIHIVAELIDASTNLFRLYMTGGAKGGTQYYLSANAEDLTNTPLTFDVELGATYFTDRDRNNVRISSHCASTMKLANVTETSPRIIYKDALGAVTGALTASQGVFPTQYLEGKRFLGWFDAFGNRYEDGDAITRKTVVTPRFIADEGILLSPSAAGYDTKGKWYTYDQTMGSEIGGTFRNLGVTDYTKISILFLYKEGATDGFFYSTFGFPYDFVDGNTRSFLRINHYDAKTWDCYAGLGGSASGEDQRMKDTTFLKNGYTLLVNMFVEKEAGVITTGYEVTNMGNGQVWRTTFSTGWTNDLIAENRLGMRFSKTFLEGSATYASYSVTDAL